MTQVKAKMSTSYMVVFVISIVMILVSILSAPATGSKSSNAYGVLVWSYTAWFMYKRNNKSLVTFYKSLLLFQGIATVICFILLSYYKEFERTVGFSALGILIFGSIGMFFSYGLLAYFKSQLSQPEMVDVVVGSTPSVPSTAIATSTVSDISDECWEGASQELSSNQRNEATWARAFAESDGDDNRTRALYIKIRASQIYSSKCQHSESPSHQEGAVSGVADNSKVDQNATLKDDHLSNDASDSPPFVIIAVLCLAVLAVLGYSSRNWPIWGTSSVTAIANKDDASGQVTSSANSTNHSVVARTEVPKASNSVADTIESKILAERDAPHYVSAYVTDLSGGASSAGHLSQQEADKSAREKCIKRAKGQNSCKKWFGRQARCIGIARDSAGRLGGAWGDNLEEVAKGAVASCLKEGGSDCAVIEGGTSCK